MGGLETSNMRERAGADLDSANELISRREGRRSGTSLSVLNLLILVGEGKGTLGVLKVVPR